MIFNYDLIVGINYLWKILFILFYFLLGHISHDLVLILILLFLLMLVFSTKQNLIFIFIFIFVICDLNI